VIDQDPDPGCSVSCSYRIWAELRDQLFAEEFATALKAELDFIREASFTDQLRRNCVAGLITS